MLDPRLFRHRNPRRCRRPRARLPARLGPQASYLPRYTCNSARRSRSSGGDVAANDEPESDSTEVSRITILRHGPRGNSTSFHPLSEIAQKIVAPAAHRFGPLPHAFAGGRIGIVGPPIRIARRGLSGLRRSWPI